MTLSYRLINGDFVVYPSGEFDESVAKDIRESLDIIIDNFTFSKLVVDMTGITFLDSTGIGVLLGRYKKLRKMGRELSVKNVNMQVDKVFSACGIYDIFAKL